MYGGWSAERNISINSGIAVAGALNRNGIGFSDYDLTSEEEAKLLPTDYDLAFIALHGRGGEDGFIQEILESKNIKYTGSDTISCKTSLNKIESKKKVGLDIDKKYILFVSSNFIRNQKRYDIYKKTVNILKTIDSKFEELLLINQDREIVPFYFNSSELHLLTSDFEGSPNSVKEALACNLDVISTNVGNVKYLLNNLKNCSFKIS